MGAVTWEKKLQRDKVKQQEKVKKDRDIPGSLSDDCSLQKHFFFRPFLSRLLPELGTFAFFYFFFVDFNLLSLFFSFFCISFSFALCMPPLCSFFCFVSCPFTLTHIATNYSNFRRVVSLLRHTVHQTTPTYGRQDIHTVNGAGQICYCTAE